jgi:MFS family permease
MCLWTVTTELGHALAFVILFGAVSGAVIGLPPASMAYILGPSSSRQAKLGQWTGLMYTCAAPFALAGPVIAGHLISKYDTYLSIQMWSGFCLLISAAAMATAIWSRRDDDSLRMGRAKSRGSSMSRLNSQAVSEATTRQNSAHQVSTYESETPSSPSAGISV